jgi:uncharacterized protein YhbP (UPF0306 family)
VESIRPLIIRLLNKVHIMQLATVERDTPWICTIHFSHTENLEFYWMSLRSTRHSTDISKNPQTAVAVVLDEPNKICLHMQGQSYELKNNDAEVAHTIYGNRYGNKLERLEDAKSADRNKRAYYSFVPHTVVLFDEVHFPDKPRQEFTR